MPRTARIAPGGVIYHVLNRGVGRRTLFRTDADFVAFLRCLIDTLAVMPTVHLLAFCVMGNHWHLLLLPERDGELAKFMLRLTVMHVRRWLEFRGRVGTGHVYQDRYKSFACESDEHFANVARYVERNPLRAGLVRRAQRWKYSSLGQHALPPELRVPLGTWPVERRRDWIAWVNRAQTPAEEAAIGRCIREQRPYGEGAWLEQMKNRLRWRERRPPGRPRKPRN